MFSIAPLRTSVLVLLIFTTFLARPLAAADRYTLNYRPAPVDNPLKGLVPYEGISFKSILTNANQPQFPHSMEFSYIPFSALVTGHDRYDWDALEKLLNLTAVAGRQAVFRVYLEFPGRHNVIPRFLIDEGLKVNTYLNTNTQPFPPQKVETPDYEDLKLRTAMTAYIAALGKRYDGDPRIGFITAGLLGTWGEWHDYPRDDLFASRAVQEEILDAYEKAFKTTPILVRYPRNDSDPKMASNINRNVGYHDDSFAWATLDTGKPADNWFFMAMQKAAGPAALDKWKTHPIGGEIRPEAWGKVFDAQPGVKEIQPFPECVRQTHVTWLMDSGLFQTPPSRERADRAREWVARMGYEFFVSAATVGEIENGKLPITVELENRGVAPFYYAWPATFGLLSHGKVAKAAATHALLTHLLPSDPHRVWRETISVDGLPPGDYQVGICVPNSLPNGRPVRFANTSQDQDVDGWLTIGKVQLR